MTTFAIIEIHSNTEYEAAINLEDWAFEAAAKIHGCHPKNHGFCPACSHVHGKVMECEKIHE